jgi:hypothetical protein
MLLLIILPAMHETRRLEDMGYMPAGFQAARESLTCYMFGRALHVRVAGGAYCTQMIGILTWNGWHGEIDNPLLSD